MADSIETRSNSDDAVDGKQEQASCQPPPSEEKGRVVHVSAAYTPEEERRVLRKIDRTVLPMMCAVFMLQYLDKQSLSYAGVFGVITDLNLTAVQFSWSSSIFYVGQLVSEYPFIYLMSRLHLTKLVGATVIVWGSVCMCLAAPTNFASFAAVRFLLGFTEGCVSPAFVTITSIWYQKDEHATRTALWVTMNGVAQVLGCLLMYGIGVNKTLALAPWRVLFLVCGAMTVAAGVVFYVFMPNGPNDSWFLTAREKEVLSARMAKDREGGDKTSFSTAQVREALLDPKAWCVFWFGVLVTMQAPVLTFASLVINSIGYDRYQTMLYTAPSGAVQVALLWIGVFLCYLFPRNRSLVVVFMCIPPLVGTVFLLKLSLDSGWGMIVASWMASCITAVMSPLLSLVASNFKGNTKRAVVNCMFFIGYCAGCIGAPQLWTEKPRYFNGVVCSIVTWCLLVVVVLVYRFLCMRDNAQRDREAAEAPEGVDVAESDGHVAVDKYGAHEGDLTDKEDRRFRYSW